MIGETEHRLQRMALRIGQIDHAVEERQDELVHTGVAERDFGFEAGDPRHR